jgi:hypothetical protein
VRGLNAVASDSSVGALAKADVLSGLRCDAKSRYTWAAHATALDINMISTGAVAASAGAWVSA